MAERQKFTSVKEYLDTMPEDVRKILEKMMKAAKEELTGIEEVISYNIPCFKKNGKYVVYFAGYKNHVSIYPIPVGDAKFQKEIEPYAHGRGTVQFKLDEEIPYDLIKKMVKILEKNNAVRTKY